MRTVGEVDDEQARGHGRVMLAPAASEFCGHRRRSSGRCPTGDPADWEGSGVAERREPLVHEALVEHLLDFTMRRSRSRSPCPGREVAETAACVERALSSARARARVGVSKPREGDSGGAPQRRFPRGQRGSRREFTRGSLEPQASPAGPAVDRRSIRYHLPNARPAGVDLGGSNETASETHDGVSPRSCLNSPKPSRCWM